MSKRADVDIEIAMLREPCFRDSLAPRFLLARLPVKSFDPNS